ncbi:Uncharacterized protein AC516_4796 [Pseudomonas amygdali pv. sesami]|nr:Uncharacterized protein AC516_4796 [Pseudomonas amygdali pv. sesami]
MTLEVNMTLKLANIQFQHHESPPKAQVGLADEHGNNVFVHVTLAGKPLDNFTLEEITKLGKEAAKHVLAKG